MPLNTIQLGVDSIKGSPFEEESTGTIDAIQEVWIELYFVQLVVFDALFATVDISDVGYVK